MKFYIQRICLHSLFLGAGMAMLASCLGPVLFEYKISIAGQIINSILFFSLSLFFAQKPQENSHKETP